VTNQKIIEVVIAYGHKNIRSTHKTTFEITKESTLTRRGDCIIAVGAMKGAADLSLKFKEAAKREDAQIIIMIQSGEIREIVRAHGTPRLIFDHPTDLVVRKSDYVCNRTIAIRADKAASDLSRKLVRTILNPHQRIKITFTVESSIQNICSV